jgi:hypothetical protein
MSAETVMPRDPMIQAITVALARPFEPRDVKHKPLMVKNNRCLAMAYIDARLIQDRLDDVLGPENWEDAYDLLPDGSVMCRLRLKLGDQWVTKIDVGSPSEQPDSGDRLKAAFSDALKRAAVKFGIGRYLYRLPAQWVDYDPVKKQIAQVPQLPAFAIPKGEGAARGTGTEERSAEGRAKGGSTEADRAEDRSETRTSEGRSAETECAEDRSAAVESARQRTGVAPTFTRVRQEARVSEVVLARRSADSRHAGRGEGRIHGEYERLARPRDPVRGRCCERI